MNIPVVMPKIGLTMTEGKIVEWRKAVGDQVEKDEVIFVFETEKVTFEVEAPQSGTLAEICAELEAIVPVGEKVALLSTDGSIAVRASGNKPAENAEDNTREGSTERTAVPAASVPSASTPAALVARSGKIRATPLARRLARDNGIALEDIAMKVDGKRLKAEDVHRAIAKGAGPEPIAAESAPGIAASGDRLVPLSGMRRIIAGKMVAAKVESAQAYMTLSVDVSSVKAARALVLPRIERESGVRPTLTDFFLKITAAAIARHPVMNTRWTDDGILWLDSIHIGLATALDDGLVVPVIRDIGSKSIAQIAAARNDLVTQARAGTLPTDQMTGSTFSLSSLGMFGVEEFTSILNQPEAAILAIGAIIDTPVAVDGRVEIRPMMKITLTYDHRIIDGAKAGVFMQTLKAMIADPILVIA